VRTPHVPPPLRIELRAPPLPSCSMQAELNDFVMALKVSTDGTAECRCS